MLKEKVVKFFEGNQSKVARALGLSRAYVSAWGEVIPELQAMKLERITDGALKYDPSLYETKHKQAV